MRTVTQDFLDKMKADRRRVDAKVTIDWTSPDLDQSITITPSDNAYTSYPQQVADGVSGATHKWASLDGSWVLDGTWHLAPEPDDLNQYQFGWWGSQLAGTDGSFVSPYPTLTITHLPRPIRNLLVTGDSARGEHPVDFTIQLYAQDNTLLYTETVTGNTAVSWSKTLTTPVLDVAKQVLTITKWSHPGRQAKILELFTSIQETYYRDDIVEIHLLEEREASQGSLPVGNISANEIAIRLANKDGKFDLTNPNSPLSGMLKPNRRIKAWLGIKGDSSGQNVSRVETTQADWAAGILTDVVATAAGNLELPTVGAPSFSRPSIAYKQDGSQVASGVPRFETGKFGQAVEVEEGTANLILNPSFESYTGTPNDWTSDTFANWTAYAEGTGGVSAWTTTDRRIYGATGIIIWQHDAPGGGYYNGVWQERTLADTGLAPGDKVSFRGWYKSDTLNMAQAKVNIHLYFYDSGGGLLLEVKPVNGGGQVVSWTQFKSENITIPANTVKFRVLCYVRSEAAYSGGDNQLYVDGLQLEKKPYCTSFHDSIRSPETLTIPTAGVLSATAGTVECWIKLLRTPGTNEQVLFDGAGPANQNLQIVIRTDGKLEARYGTGTATVTITGTTVLTKDIWYAAAVRWSSAGVALFLNGAAEGSSTTAPSLSFGANAYLGSKADGTLQIDGLIDDLRVSSIARTDTEISAAYTAGVPLPVDASTTYKFNMDNSLAPISGSSKSGNRLSPTLDLSPVGIVVSSKISWTATTPSGTAVTVETSLDGGTTWQAATNGGTISGITPEMNLTGKSLLVRQTLTTQDATVTPQLHDLTVQVNHEEWIPLGVFWSLDWDAPDDVLEANTKARDRLELLRKSTYKIGTLQQNVSLYTLAQQVLQDAGLQSTDYAIDTALQSIVVPWGWLPPMSHRDALRLIAEAGLAVVYADRDGIIRIQSMANGLGTTPVLTIAADDYFPPLSSPARQENTANEIIVTSTAYQNAPSGEEVYRSQTPINIPAGQTVTVTVQYNKIPVFGPSAGLVNPPSGVSITAATYYAWGAEVSIQNTNTSAVNVTLAVSGYPLQEKGGERVVVQDQTSIWENGLLRYEFSKNHLVQTRAQAQAIADALLASAKNPRRDLEFEWRGNPALELGDRVMILGQDVHVIRQELNWAGAFSARLVGRRVQ